MLSCRRGLVVLLAAGILSVPLPALPAAAGVAPAPERTQATPLPDPGRPSAVTAQPSTVVKAPGKVAAPAAPASRPVDRATYTTHSKTVQNADGTRTATIYGTPTFRREGANWVEVAPKLRAASDEAYPYEISGAAAPIRLGRTTKGLAQIGFTRGAVTLTLENTADRAPEPAGPNEVRYRDIADGVDLRVGPTAAGVRADHVIRDASAPHRFTYRLADPAGVLGQLVERDGINTFTGDDGMGLRIEPAVAYEVGTPEDERGDLSSAHQTIRKVDGGYLIEEWVDDEWMSRHDYPIVLDPALTLTGAAAGNTDCHIVSGASANTVLCSPAANEVGSATTARRLLYQFPNDPIPAGSTVTAANLALTYNTFLGSAGSLTLNLHKVSSGQLWTLPSWNNRNTTTSPMTAWTTAGGSYNALVYDSNAVSSSTIAGTKVNFDVTSALSYTTQQTGPNTGFLIKANNETTPTRLFFASSEEATASKRPQLVVTYTAPTWPQPTAVSGDSSARVSWSHGTDNGTRTGYRVRVVNGITGAATGASVTTGATATSVTVPGLLNDVIYRFWVDAIYPSDRFGPANTTSNVTPRSAGEMTAGVGGSTRWGNPAPFAAIEPAGDHLDLVVSLHSRTNASQPYDVYSPIPTKGRSGRITIDGAPCTGTVSCTIGTTADGTRDSLIVKGVTVGGWDIVQVRVEFLPLAPERGCVSLFVPRTEITVQNVTEGATSLSFASPSKDINDKVCDGGLGNEPWYSYTTTDIGPYGSAAVNVANGNLVVQQADTTPVQMHGRLALFTRRTYNSQDTTMMRLPGSIGAGWTLNVGSLGVGGGALTPGGLAVGSLTDSLTNPFGITLIDRDGTRHQFGIRKKALRLAAPAGNVATALVPANPPAGSLYCVDVSYSAPPGVQLSLWRYLIADGTSCATGTNLRIGGYVALRTDRLRTEFDATGRVTAVIDGAGNQLEHVYDATGRLTEVSERLRAAGTPRKITFAYHTLTANNVAAACSDAKADIAITDPAGRVTTYCLDDEDFLDIVSAPHLLRVVNPDGSTIDYTYSALPGLGGAAATTCGASLYLQLCSITESRPDTPPATTAFTYAAATDLSVLTLPRVSRVTDRRGTVKDIAYDYGSAYVDADTANSTETAHRTRWQSIDSFGRVGERLEGLASATSITAFSDVVSTWDTTGSGAVRCRAHDDGQRHNELCATRRKTLAVDAAYTLNGFTAAPDQLVDYQYGPEGQLLRERKHTNAGAAGDALDVTYGYGVQSVNSTGGISCYQDTVAGSGNVTVGTAASACPSTTVTSATGARGSDPVMVIVDRTQSLTPRGNAAGAAYASYRTTTDVNRDPGSPVNGIVSGSCATTARNNSGLACGTTAPFDGSTFATTTYEYDQYGQRTKMTNPRGKTMTYGYYGDADRDLTGTTPAGGWLRSVKDPANVFVVFAYDRAGNVTRTWDRNATKNTSETAYSRLSPAPPSLAYREVLREALPGTGNTSYSSPWRWVVSDAGPLVVNGARAGNRTTYVVDRNGNALRTTPPRGNKNIAENVTAQGAAQSPYDVVRTFDAAGKVLTVQLPLSSASVATEQPPTTYVYDAFGNVDYETDPLGHVTDHVYDALNRHRYSYVQRGSTTDTTLVANATGCGAVGAWTPAPKEMPDDALVCRTMATFRDGSDQAYLTSDPIGARTFHVFDGAGRPTKDAVERVVGDGAAGQRLTSSRVYNADGLVDRACTPRDAAEGANAACAAPAKFGTNNLYDTAGRLTDVTTYRDATTANTTHYTYDLNGNVTAVRDARLHTTTTDYDDRDRKVCVHVPRAAGVTHVATWEYDDVGNVVRQTRPGAAACPTALAPSPAGRATTYAYDTANRLTDTIDNPGGGESATGGSDVHTRRYYDEDGNVTAVAEPRAFASGEPPAGSGHVTTTDFDEHGRPMTTYRPRSDGATAPPALTDTNGSPISDQDTQCPTGVAGYAAGVHVCVTRTRYDVAGNKVMTWLGSAGGATTGARHVDYEHTPDRLLAAITAAAPTGSGASTVTERRYYDARGAAVRDVDALSRPTTYTYTGDGLLHQQTKPANGTVTHQRTSGYDDNGNVTSTTDYSGVVTQTAYTNDNLPTRTVTPNDRPGTADPAGDVTTTTYDAVGNPEQVFSPAANAAGTAYADAAATAKVPTWTTYTWDNKPLASVVPVSPNGYSTLRRTTYDYDAAGRAIAQHVDTVSDTAANARSYTSNNDTVTRTTGYYVNDRVKSESAGTRTLSYEYDLAGNKTRAADSAGTTSGTVVSRFYLDGSPREVDAGGRRTAYLYDGQGAMVARAYSPLDANGNAMGYEATRYTYDDAGMLQRMRSPVAASLLTGIGETTWSYDLARRTTSRSDANGALSSYTHANDDTLTSVSTVASGTTVTSWGYTYDSGYRVKTATEAGQTAAGLPFGPVTATFTYGESGRVSSFGIGTQAVEYYEWDHNGNRLCAGADCKHGTVVPTGTARTSWTYGADNAITSETASGSSSSVGYTYEPFGAVRSDGVSKFCYDGFQRLSGSTTAAGSCATPAATYEYDALSRQERTTSAGGTHTMRYDGTGDQVVRDVVGDDTTEYALMPDGTALALRDSALAAPQFLGMDGGGSVTSVFNAVGLPACQVRYDAFGDTKSVTGETAASCATATTNNRWYRAQRRDDASGQYRFGNRTYDPKKASFLEPDSHGPAAPVANTSVGVDPVTANTYAYVNGDPVNYVDPSGHRRDCGDQARAACERANTALARRQNDAAIRVRANDRAYCAKAGLEGKRCDFAIMLRDGRSAFDIMVSEMRAARSAHCQYVTMFKFPQARPEDSGVHRVERCDTDAFVRDLSHRLAGLDPGRFALPEGAPEGPRRDPPGEEITGSSGWNPSLIDGDESPARHFIGWFATGYFHPKASNSGLSHQERSEAGGSSLQDVRSGRIAIDLGIKLQRGEDIGTIIDMVVRQAGDPSYPGGPRTPEPSTTSTPWYFPTWLPFI